MLERDSEGLLTFKTTSDVMRLRKSSGGPFNAAEVDCRKTKKQLEHVLKTDFHFENARRRQILNGKSSKQMDQKKSPIQDMLFEMVLSFDEIV